MLENLFRMSKFAGNFTQYEIMSQPATQIPWFTIVEIMSQPVTQIQWGTLINVIIAKSNTHEEML